MAKKDERSDIELCHEYRKKLKLKPEYDIAAFNCNRRQNNALRCWEKCPVPSRIKDKQRQVTLPDGQPLPIVAPTEVAGFMEKLGEEVYGGAPKIPRAVESFLTMQSRVISKLAWRPEIWLALDSLNTDEILDRLVGKTGLDGVPTMMGGNTPFRPSNKTKKMFADLEKKFAAEGDVPYESTEEPKGWTTNDDLRRWRLPKNYQKNLAKDELKLKQCQEHRQKSGRLDDFRIIDCVACLVFEDCPIWAEGENGKT